MRCRVLHALGLCHGSGDWRANFPARPVLRLWRQSLLPPCSRRSVVAGQPSSSTLSGRFFARGGREFLQFVFRSWFRTSPWRRLSGWTCRPRPRLTAKAAPGRFLLRFPIWLARVSPVIGSGAPGIRARQDALAEILPLRLPCFRQPPYQDARPLHSRPGRNADFRRPEWRALTRSRPSRWCNSPYGLGA